MENKPAHANCEYFINVDGMSYCAVKDLYSLTTKKNDDMIEQDKIEESERYIAGWNEADYNCKLPDPIGQLVHEPTMTRLSVYKPISRFKRIMLRWCFGLKYEKI